MSELTERQRLAANIRHHLITLTRQSEDYIWRTAEAAIDVLDAKDAEIAKMSRVADTAIGENELLTRKVSDQDAEIAELRAKVEMHDADIPVRFQLWRGECGHHWIKSESEDCPVCAGSELRAKVSGLEGRDQGTQDAVFNAAIRTAAAKIEDHDLALAVHILSLVRS